MLKKFFYQNQKFQKLPLNGNRLKEVTRSEALKKLLKKRKLLNFRLFLHLTLGALVLKAESQNFLDPVLAKPES